MTSDELINQLKKHAEDRGLMAHLRRWWSPTTRHYALPALARIAGGQNLDNLPLCLTAALYAEHPEHSAKVNNLGTTCRRIAGKELDTFETHFRRLLACQQLRDLGPVLHRVIKRSKTESAPVNYVELHQDLTRWRHSAEKIKTAWAKEFWKVPTEEYLDTPAS